MSKSSVITYVTVDRSNGCNSKNLTSSLFCIGSHVCVSTIVFSGVYVDLLSLENHSKKIDLSLYTNQNLNGRFNLFLTEVCQSIDAIFLLIFMELFYNKMHRNLNSVYTPQITKLPTFSLKK